MKKYILILFILLLSSYIFAQRGHGGVNIYRNTFDELCYEDNTGFKAKLTKNIFDEYVYSDNNKNEVKYSPQFWTSILLSFKHKQNNIIRWLVQQHISNNGYKEEFKIDIFGNQQYKNNTAYSASLKKNVFDTYIFTDSNNNKLEYANDIWSDLLYNDGNDINLYFMRLIDFAILQTNYKEEFKKDIFGDISYSNSNGQKASLEKQFKTYPTYQDSNGNKWEFNEREWSRILRNRTESALFIDLINEYLFKIEY